MQMLIATRRDRLVEQIAKWPGLILGQLQEPISNYKHWGGRYAIDNGAFSRFREDKFRSVIHRHKADMDLCLFVAMPDVVGDARRTLEVFPFWYEHLAAWPKALVAQDGIEDLAIPWELLDAIFIGGTTEFKMSDAAAGVIKAAQILGKHVHIGRVNTPKRFLHFEKLGADTCDGSGCARFDWMIDAIGNRHFNDMPLFDSELDQRKDGE